MPFSKLEKKYGHKQAIAIVLSEKRKHGGKLPKEYQEGDGDPAPLKGLKKAKPQF